MECQSHNGSNGPKRHSSAEKIMPLRELGECLNQRRGQGSKIVHCHGVFDLLHIGHIKHLEAARKLGDVLVVTITPDRFVNKGPHRPAFPERLRAEALAALACVDYVGINEWPTSVETIGIIRPNLYVKGFVPKQGKRDHTDAIVQEENAVKAVGGQLVLTEEETFSASSLINRFVEVFSPEAKAFLEQFGHDHSSEEIIGRLQAIEKLKVLTVGESFIDEYQFCDVMGKSGKDPILAARHLHTEKYAGGTLAIANHLAGFCPNVGLLSVLGEIDSQEEFIRSRLNSKISASFLRKPDSPTIVKRRFLQDYLAVKLFEVYVMRNEQLTGEQEERFCQMLEEMLPQYDVVVVADYGHGLFTERIIKLLCEKAKFLAVNAQTNAGNRGFNFVSKYPRADYVSIDEPEARLETRSTQADLRELTEIIARKMSCNRFMVTRGKKGCLLYDRDSGFAEVPAFSVKLVDRTGAGDAVLALTAPLAAMGLPSDQVGFIGNVIGAEACAIMGNSTSIDRSSLFRHITSLLQW